VPLLSVCEIAATKAYTIGRRGELKDYVDLYFVLAEGHVRLPEIIVDAEAKFGDESSKRIAWRVDANDLCQPDRIVARLLPHPSR
jgi:hypothetical protein